MNKIINIIIYKIYPLIIEISIKIKWFFFKFFFYKYKKNSDCIVAVTFYKKRFPALYFTLLSILLQKLKDLVNMILEGTSGNPGWSFEDEWNGYETYIFIHYNSAISGSQALWISDTKEALLNNSPMNVHYFFLSSRSVAESDAEAMSNVFSDILQDMSSEMQIHWSSHLHFCPIRVSELDGWLPETLDGEYAIGIDRFQRIKQIGYLGNPASFTGTYMNYLAHEATYFNYEFNNKFIE